MKKLDILVAVLLIVGGLNWGLIGAFQFDLVGTMFGDIEKMPTIIYTMCGMAALYTLYEKVTKREAEGTK